MVEVVSVVIAALESVTKEFDGWIEKLRSNAKDCIVGDCEDIEKSAGDVKKTSFC